MSSSLRLLPPAKRRRTKRSNQLLEDDVNALDTVTVERITVDTKRGSVQKKIFVPIPTPKDSGKTENNIRADEDNVYPSNDYEENDYDDMQGEFDNPTVPLDTAAPLKKTDASSNIQL
jgi:hypothetical protein